MGKNVPEVVVLQVRVAQASIGARAARGNIVINPEGKIRAKTARADNREGIGHKQIWCGEYSQWLARAWVDWN